MLHILCVRFLQPIKEANGIIVFFLYVSIQLRVCSIFSLEYIWMSISGPHSVRYFSYISVLVLQ